jgi:hypothetical protein
MFWQFQTLSGYQTQIYKAGIVSQFHNDLGQPGCLVVADPLGLS